MNYSRTPNQHTGKVAHAGHAPPKFRSPTNNSSTLPMSTLSYIRRPLPPAPRNKDSSSGLSGPQPNNVTAHLRNFEHHIPLKHDVKYIYAVNPSSPNIVYFFEYRGHGAPSSSLGALGDVYIDLTQNSYSLYAKGGMGWGRWSGSGWFEHPFLTDTVLWFSLEGIVWMHPTMVDRPSQTADIHTAIRDMLDHEEELRRNNQAPPKQPETESREDSDITAAGNGSRKRPRVDSEPPSMSHVSEPPPSSISAQQLVHIKEVDLRQANSAPPQTASPNPQPDRSASSHQPRKKIMDLRISGLQEEMTKLQEHLRELQGENTRVTQRNANLEREMEVLRDVNEKLKGKLDESAKGKTADADHTPSTTPVAGARGQSGPGGANSTCSGANNKSILGRFAQPPNGNSDAVALSTSSLPADVQNRLQGHVNYLATIMDDVFDTHHHLQRAEKANADQKLQITTLSADVQRLEDECSRMEAERKAQEERLVAMNAWLMGAPKFDHGAARTA